MNGYTPSSCPAAEPFLTNCRVDSYALSYRGCAKRDSRARFARSDAALERRRAPMKYCFGGSPRRNQASHRSRCCPPFASRTLKASRSGAGSAHSKERHCRSTRQSYRGKNSHGNAIGGICPDSLIFVQAPLNCFFSCFLLFYPGHRHLLLQPCAQFHRRSHPFQGYG